MNLTIPLFLVTLMVSFISFSQKNPYDNQMKWTSGWTNYDPNHALYPEPEEKLPTIINYDAYLSNDSAYLMSGNVYVTNGATLTIQEGTIIICDSEAPTSLVVSKGAKLIAKGNKRQPIIFTSSKPAKTRKSGDWGGIIIAGSGPTNSPSGSGIIEGDFIPKYAVYGGKKVTEETTILSYIRIEFAGKKINFSKELNGLSLYALGASSIINNIMISYANDDSFEFYGGVVNAYNLISYKTKDDDFDFTYGYKGTLDNLLAVRHPYISDVSGSYAIEIDGYDKNSGMLDDESVSYAQIKNATIINLSDHSNYQHTTAAICSKNLGKLKIEESKISGFANVVKFDKSYTSYTDIKKSLLLENNIFNVHANNVIGNYSGKMNLENLFQYNMFTTQFKSVTELFENPLHKRLPKFTLKESQKHYTMQ